MVPQPQTHSKALPGGNLINSHDPELANCNAGISTNNLVLADDAFFTGWLAEGRKVERKATSKGEVQ